MKKLRNWAGVACVLALGGGASALAQDDTRVTQGISVTVSGRESGNREVDRVEVNADYTWQTGRRERLSVRLPWQSIDSSAPGVSNSASGLKDATLKYDFGVREPGEGGIASRWQFTANIPTGKDGLTQNEFAAVSALSGSANSFLAPQFGRGFGAGFRRYWTKATGNAQMEWYVGFQKEGDYTLLDTPATRIENSGVDQYVAGISRNWSQGDQDWNVGLDVIATGTALTETNGVGTRVESDPNYVFKLGKTRKFGENINSRLNLTYQLRDSQDSFSPGVLVNLGNNDLGDRFFWSWMFEREDASNSVWSLGTTGMNTSHTENAAGQTVAGSARLEIYGSLGYRRNLDNGGAFNFKTDIGLNSDARDYAVSAAYSRSF